MQDAKLKNREGFAPKSKTKEADIQSIKIKQAAKKKSSNDRARQKGKKLKPWPAPPLPNRKKKSRGEEGTTKKLRS